MIENAPADGTAGRWHALAAADAIASLATSVDGLSREEAADRLRRIGPNQLPEPPRTSPVVRFLRQFHSVLIYFLLSGAVAAALLGHPVDAAMIVIVVVVNAIVGFLQEGRAERALDAIRDMIAPHAVVVRGGTRESIDAREIVPGDVLVLEAGDKVPADIRLVRARTLLANEAILTGESLPAEKAEAPVAEAAALGDRSSMLYSGTLIATGQATGIAVETGGRTEIGRISALISEVRTLTTPLLAQINQFGRFITFVAMGLALGLYAWAILVNREDPVEALMLVVALAVGLVPEGLPAVITVTLAIGVQRMAARHAVVRRLPAVETLGATSVICSDKTGTLTQNEMTARQVVTASGEATVTGEGYAPHGTLEAAGADPTRDMLVRAALLCNDARLVEDETSGLWRVLGDPMEGALVTLAAKAGLHPETERDAWTRIDEIPFDAQHRFMATLHADPDGSRRLFVKGAPERIVALCGAGPDEAAVWAARVAALAGEGERVLGFATRAMPPGSERLAFDDVGGLTMLGLVGLIDPPRAEAITAVADCASAGIAVKMITGDHADTAVAIARQLAIAEAPEALTGADLDDLDDAGLVAAAERASVFARTSPEHKLRIVRALQSRGKVVAMTGDGVNDAPSLKQADVGIAMGRKGTEAAKEAAEMVLVDDNFASIAAAVYEGRTVYDNIRKVIGWTLPTNGGEALCIIVAVLLGLALPMMPVHILWINMVTTVTLGLTLAFEPPEPGVMRRPPRRRDAPLLSPLLIWRISFVSVLFMLGVFAVYEFAIARGRGVPVAHTMVVNAIVVMEIFYLFNVRYAHMSSFSLIGAAGTPPVLAAIAVVVVAQLAFTYFGPLQAVMGAAPLHLSEGLLVVAIGVLLMLIMEGEKIVTRRLGLREA